MQVSKNYPPNFYKIEQAFPECKGKAVYCFGDTVYNPHNLKITPDLMEHEQVHSLRQGLEPDKWWDKYIADARFRLDEELRAFAHQWSWMKQFISSKNSENFLDLIADVLASGLYNLSITEHQAKTQVRHMARELNKA